LTNKMRMVKNEHSLAFLEVIEVVSKPRIRFESKAQPDEKAQHTREVCEHFEEDCNTAIEP